MSNYHGAPFYGTPYNHNGHMPLPIPPPAQESVQYGTIAQPGYHQYHNPIPLQPPQNIHPAQFNNLYAYNTNAHYPTMGVHGAITAPPPPLPQFAYHAYAQYPASGPPQSPFPPFHVANHNVSSQRLAASVPLPPSPHVFQPPTNLPPKPISSAPLRTEAKNIIPENVNALATAVGITEDSEVNEAELREALNSTSSVPSNVPPQFNEKYGRISMVAQKDVLRPSIIDLPASLKDLPQRSPLLNALQNGVEGDRVESEKGSRETILEPLRFEKNGLVNSANLHIETSRASNSPALPLSSRSIQLCTGNFNKDVSHVDEISSAQSRWQQSLIDIENLEHKRRPQALREKVKLALQKLHQENIRFVNLVGEGINPSLLKELYDEIGIKTTEIFPPKDEQKSESEPTRVANPKSDFTTSNSDSFVPPPADSTTTPAIQPTSIAAAPTKPVSQTKLLTKLSPTRRSPPTVVADLSKSDQAVSVALSSLHRSKPTNHNSSKALPDPNTDRALERKDYIAKMLAAKVGKGATSKTPKQVTSSRSETGPANQKTMSNADIPTTIKVFESDMKQVNNNDQEELEAKKKASTELALRKIEALRIRSTDFQGSSVPARTNAPITAVTSVHESSQASEKALGQPSGRSILLNDAELPTQYAIGAVSAAQQYTPETPFFAPLEQRPLNGLPGLPGLSMSDIQITTPATIEQSLAQQHIKSSDSNPSDPAFENEDPITRSASPQRTHLTTNSGAQVSLEMDSLTAAEKKPADIDMKPEYLVEDKASKSPSAPAVVSEGQGNPRKRATASDFIDNQTDSVKHQRGPKGRVVIEVSEDEDANDEDAMELDNPLEPENTESRITNGMGESRAKTSRDIPTLSSIPTWSKASVASATSTPPPVQTPGKSSEPEELVRAEEKIRLLKQMIAEREERQKAKHSITSGGQSPRLANNGSVNDQASLKNLIEKANSVTEAIQKGQALEGVRQGLDAQKSMIEAVEKNMQANLELEKRAQASVIARAEEEREEAAKATTTAERQYRERRKATLEAALPELDAQISKAKFKLDEMRKQKEELEAEIQRGSEGRKMILEELDALLLDQEDEQPTADKDLVQLDEVVDRSDDNSGPSIESREPSTEPYDHATPMFSVHTASHISSSDSVRSTTPATNGISPTESPDENMDISSSSDDDEQLTSLVREVSPERQAMVASNSGDEEYEPPLDANIILQHSPRQNSSTDSISVSKSLPTARNTQINGSDKSDSSVEDNSSLEEGEVSGNVFPADAGESEDYEPPEPLSPVDNKADHPTVEDLGPQPPLVDLEQEKILAEQGTTVAGAQTIADISLFPDAAPNHSQVTDVPKIVDTFKSGHFTPYESPLKLFTSYRYHPKYVSEVPGGFRSLTYSHKINPKEPLCIWELAGGVCNDDSCVYQHFRSMPLTDNMILVQLGSTNEGNTPEEKDAYVSGLKQIIHNMRERRITDFNTVAQEITAYRSSFLGDGSRVLTL